MANFSQESPTDKRSVCQHSLGDFFPPRDLSFVTDFHEVCKRLRALNLFVHSDFAHRLITRMQIFYKMPKTKEFEGYNLDIERLATRIQTYLTENHFEVAFSKDTTKSMPSYFIQARKLGVLRTATGARRSTDIIVKGMPGYFELTIGTGEWGNNLIVSAPLFVIPVIGIAATITRLYTAKKFETNLWKYIKGQAEFLRDSAGNGKKIATKTADQREYDCDYVEGYPGWNAQVVGGKLILERQKTGTDKLIFEAPDGEQITIPATKIEKAVIISRKKSLNENDLMVEITCKDRDGKTINPVLNFADDVIAGVLAGINELVAEEKYLKKAY